MNASVAMGVISYEIVRQRTAKRAEIKEINVGGIYETGYLFKRRVNVNSFIVYKKNGE